MLGCGGATLFGRSLRALANLVFFFKNLYPPDKTSVLVLFARAAATFDLLGVKSSSNMNWKVNAKLEDALASKFLSGVNLGSWKAPQHDFPPLKSSKMTTNVIWLEYAQYRPQEGRWTFFDCLPYP